jgi:hypothetical protein
MPEITALVRHYYGGIGGDGQTVEIHETHFAAAQKWAQIVDAVVDLDPICRSSEGLDDGCFFCGVEEVGHFSANTFVRTQHHAPDCLWVAARRLAGKET